MKYPVQVNKSYYSLKSYLAPKRLSTYCLLLLEVASLDPKKILEIGPGNYFLTKTLKLLNYNVKTLDLDPQIKPDYVIDVSSDEILNLKKEGFDLVVASQVLEHIQYKDFVKTLRNLRTITPRLLLTLPYARAGAAFLYLEFVVPLLKKRVSLQREFYYKRKRHQFTGEHYWEIGKIGFTLKKIRKDISKAGWKITKSYFNRDHPYHYFLVLNKDE
ncbi:methyltransferase type 11 [Candidatus Berkelbacteria bacterium CG10_big_fil_rev_8_21_14_0_10_41_12]|uniref:Methyltransferase type 11 n=1 Tax=Candidatus Berkelbacteria bacterium CG10_big_fil_rev_8_21_14_0_10_41_12 TaxID=1974513 RepID=A0A2M6WY61_9BACT|nr:MAG: methyltransferase type 11 [Candidatus Berkelbacteria bacterium CG10_big_fil_rev_8_21_14_0_10_41_12]